MLETRPPQGVIQDTCLSNSCRLKNWLLDFRGTYFFIPGPNLDTGMTVEFSVAFYSPTLHIYYLSLYWPDLKH